MTIHWRTWLLVSSIVSASIGPSFAATASGLNESGTDDLICQPFGTCEPCPEDALNEPFCQPFGNRRLMHCSPSSQPSPQPQNPQPPPTSPDEEFPPYSLDDSSDGSPSSQPGQGVIPAWEACGRIPERERADFYEFVACNLFIAVLALVVLLARSKRLKAMHARQLAARIGLVRGTPEGWVNG